MNKPELLAPAGSAEKFKVAVKYGADAVYLAGQRFGLRAMADNFTNVELARAVTYAQKYNVKVYVVLNAFLHDEDLVGLDEFVRFLEEIGVSAVIVSDLGVISLVQAVSKLPVHLSTQASCLSVESAKLWKRVGVSRVIVGRELTIAESAKIAQEADLEVEMFVHGAMCMAYSGNCVISNFTAGRDSNRGGCIQSCRFSYEHKEVSSFKPDSLKVVSDTNSAQGGYFMSSRDQQGVRLVPEFIEHGISSLKIEGRMKSVLYVATLVSAYRKVIDAVLEGKITEDIYRKAEIEVATIPHREYFNGSMLERAKHNSTYEHSGESATKGSHSLLGLVVDASQDRLALRLNKTLRVGSGIQFLTDSNEVVNWSVSDLRAVNGTVLETANQESIVTIPRFIGSEKVNQFTVVRVGEEGGHGV